MIFIPFDFLDYPFRYWYVGINFITIYLSIQLSATFLIGSAKGTEKNVVRLLKVLGIVILIIAVNFTLKLITHYTSFDEYIIQRILYISATAASSLAIIIIEPVFRKNYFFSIVAIITTVLFVFIDPATNLIILPYAGSIIIFIFPVLFIRHLYMNSGGNVRKRIGYLIVSILIMYGGILLNMERLMEFLPSEIFVLIGYILIDIGLVGIYASFKNVNVFIESGWQQYVEELYIIQKSSLQVLYQQNLFSRELENDAQKNSTNQTTIQNKALFSGGLVGINSLLKEVSESRTEGIGGLSLIELQGKYLMIEHAQDAMICFITKKNLDSLRYFLRKIRDTFENYYCTHIIDWEHIETNMFASMQTMVKTILTGEKA